LGLIPGWGGTQRLARLIGSGMASEIILTGRTVTADEALRIGLVNKVVPDAELLPAALEMARVIADKSPEAIKFAKEALQKGFDLSLNEALNLEAGLEDAVLHTPGFEEATRAYREKRQAHSKNKENKNAN
jgi:enoyl-CoA hydratase